MVSAVHVKLCGEGCGCEGVVYVSSCMVWNMGEIGGEVEETELVLLGRLIRPPNEPSRVLGVG